MSERYNIPLFIDPCPDTNFSHFEVYRAPELAIIGVSQINKTFTIEGKFASWYDVGDELVVSLSTGNDGSYTVTSAGDDGFGNTFLIVAEAIPSAVADGLIKQTLLRQLAIKSSSTSFEDKGLPAGFYYYVIYAVDKEENYSDPSQIIIKSAPEDVNPPATPTGLTIRRSDDLLSMELYWNANTEEDLKGYIIYRSFDGLTYDVIALLGSTANNYKDSRIPPQMDTDSNTTPVIYAVSALNKSFLESIPAGPTTPLEVPILSGLRAIIDYLSLNVYWNVNLPEDGITDYDIYYREVGTVPWILAGSVPYPQMSFRIDGPLVSDTTYEVGVVVKPYTGATAYLQPLPIPITIPFYDSDTTRPTSPEFLEADMDPENNRMFLAWKRIKIDNDFLQYQIWMGKLFDIIAVDQVAKTFTIDGHAFDYLYPGGESLQVTDSTTGNNGIYTIIDVTPGGGITTVIQVNEAIASPIADGKLFQPLLDGVTTQNNYTLIDMRRYFAREDAPVDRAFMLIVTAVDRSGNQSIPYLTTYLREYWMSQDETGPAWIDFIRTINSGLFKEHDGTDMAVTPYAQFYLQWNDIGRVAKHFRRYIVFETTRVDPTVPWGNPAVGGVPLFDFDDDTQIRGFTTDNTFQVYNHDLARGFRTLESGPSYTNRAIVAINTVFKLFGVGDDQRGHFRIGDTLRVYGQLLGDDGDYTIVGVSYSSGTTYIEVSRVIASGSVAGFCFDVQLDKSKWYTILAEDWFGDRYPGTLAPVPVPPLPPYPFRRLL
jgi:hypothetical protein